MDLRIQPSLKYSNSKFRLNFEQLLNVCSAISISSIIHILAYKQNKNTMWLIMWNI